MTITIWTGGTETIRSSQKKQRCSEIDRIAIMRLSLTNRELAELLTDSQQAIRIENEVLGCLNEAERERTTTPEDTFWTVCNKTYDCLKDNGYYVEARQLDDLRNYDAPVIIIWDYIKSLPSGWTWKQQDPSSLSAVSAGLVSPR